MTPWLWVLLASISGQVALQPKPDFSGRWVLVDGGKFDPDVARELEIRQSTAPVFRVLTVERRSKSGVRSERYEIGVMGGTVPGLGERDSRPPVGPEMRWTRESVLWDGDTLAIKNGRYSGPTVESGPYAEHEERWSLNARGLLLMIITDQRSGTDLRTTRRTYRRLRGISVSEAEKTRYFKEDHLTGAAYLALIPDGSYQIVNREHMGVWFTESGIWNRSGTRIELKPRQPGKSPYSGTEVFHRGRTFLALENAAAPGMTVNVDDTKRQLDRRPRTVPSYVFFEISKAVHDRETRERYPFRTRRAPGTPKSFPV